MRKLAIPILALLAAACGSSGGKPPSAGPPKDAAAAAFRYASCMRDHGVGNFPDPQVSSSNGGQSIKQMLPASAARSPRFKSAQNACRGIMPGPLNSSQVAAQQLAHRQALLALARCMRSHGIPNFPDPTSQGQLPPQMLSSAGVGIHTRSFLIAADGCVGVTHGMITKAQVAEAVNRGG